MEVSPTKKKQGLDESESSETPKEIAEWIEWFKTLEPLDMTPDELDAFGAEMRASKEAQKELLRKSWEKEDVS